MNNQTAIWDNVGRVCMYLLFGLVPIFFLPLTAFPLPEGKALLAGALVFIALGSWLARVLADGEITVAKTWVWAPLGGLVLVGAISSFLSGSTSLSIWGNLTAPDSFFNFLIYALALFLVPIYMRDIGQISRAILFFSASVFVVAIYSILQFFGLFLLPFDFTKQISFNTVGTVQALAIYLGAGLVMMAALFTSFRLAPALKIVFSLGSALLLFILLLINFNFVWLGLFVASALIVSWQMMHVKRATSPLSISGGELDSLDSKEKNAEGARGVKLSMPLVLMIVVAILFFANPPITNIVQLPAEVRPSLSATLDISRSTLSSNVTRGLFGSGPATFIYDYFLHRSPDLNQTAFWGVRFSQGYSTIATLLATMGVLGVLSIFAMFGLFIFSAFRGISTLSRQNSPAERTALVSFVGFIFLAFSWFFYPINFTLYLVTFLLAGLVIASLKNGNAIKSLDFSILKSQQRTFIGSLIIIVLIVGVIVGLYWHGQKYVASIFHTSGVRVYNESGDVAEATRKVNLAISLDREQDRYLRTFAQLLGLRASEVLSSSDLNSAELQQRYRTALQGLLAAAQESIKVNPTDPLNWRQLGAIYEDNIFLVSGADDFAITNYKEAVSRNPQNPAEYLNVARAYVRSSDNIQRQIAQLSQAGSNPEDIERLSSQRRERLSSALEYLNKSIGLKADYAPAHFLNSQVYERQGNRKLAIEETLKTRNLNPIDTGVGYQLGLLYYLDGQLPAAQTEFERVVLLNTNFSNARYFLGLIYDRAGDAISAIGQFEKIESLNPGNQEVKRILENLRADRGALSGIVPPATAPEERIETPVPQTGGQEEDNLLPTDTQEE